MHSLPALTKLVAYWRIESIGATYYLLFEYSSSLRVDMLAIVDSSLSNSSAEDVELVEESLSQTSKSLVGMSNGSSPPVVVEPASSPLDSRPLRLTSWDLEALVTNSILLCWPAARLAARPCVSVSSCCYSGDFFYFYCLGNLLLVC